MDERLARLHFAAIFFEECGAFELACFCRQLIKDKEMKIKKGEIL